MNATKISARHILLLILMAAAVLIIPGSDVYTHIHQAWLYNHMIQHRSILEKDPSMLSGQQEIYDRSIPAYALAGAAWFVFQKSTVKILELISFLGIVAVSLALFRNKGMLFFWYALIFVKFLLFDEYPYLFSFLLFYLGIYLIRKFGEKPFGDIAILAAGINHPYVAATNLVTAFFRRKILFAASLIILILQIVLVKFFFFTGLVNFDFYNLIDFALRSVLLLFPLFAENLTFMRHFITLKWAYFVAIFGIFVIYPFTAILFSHGFAVLSCYYTKTYSQIPQLEGNVRIVDDCKEWIYVFPLRGITSSESQEFQGQYYRTTWTEEKYVRYLMQSNTSYVIFCKDCNVKNDMLRPTGELTLLNMNFPVYEDLQEYVIFDVRKASQIKLNATKRENSFFGSVGKRLHNLTKNKT